MFEYNLSVSMSDSNLKINDKIKSLIEDAAREANSRRNASRKERVFEVKELIDEYHINIVLLSESEVIPSRALSALSRCMIYMDSDHLLEGHFHRGCVLNTALLSSNEENKSTISDVEMFKEITSIFFDRSSLNNRGKKLARDTTEKIREIVIDYINNKTISKQ